MSALTYSVDNAACLTLTANDATLTIDAAQVNELVEFLGAISFKALAQRIDARMASSSTLINPDEA